MDELDLREIVQEYLYHNGLSLGYMSRATQISKTSLFTWVRGDRELSVQNIRKIKDFLSGKFLIDVQTIIGNLLIRKEYERDEKNASE